MTWPTQCPRCTQPMTAQGWACDEGFVCEHCHRREVKAKKRRRKRSPAAIERDRQNLLGRLWDQG